MTPLKASAQSHTFAGYVETFALAEFFLPIEGFMSCIHQSVIGQSTGKTLVVTGSYIVLLARLPKGSAGISTYPKQRLDISSACSLPFKQGLNN